MPKKSPLETALEALPDNPRRTNWTLEQDAAILKFCESKGYVAVGRALGVTPNTVRRRFLELKERLKK